MKILILGANGMLGHVLSYELYKLGIDITCVTKGKLFMNGPKSVQFNLVDFSNLDNILMENFDYIVNCAAILVKDSDLNNLEALRINSFLPKHIDNFLKKFSLKTVLIHISTNSVFEFSEKPYTEVDLFSPITFYDLTKVLGEVYGENRIVLRSGVVGFERNTNRSLLNWLKISENPVQGYEKDIWSGSTNLEYSRKIISLIKNKINKGVFHISNNKKISKYELLLMVNKIFFDNNKIILKNQSISRSRILINSTNDICYINKDYYDMFLDLKDWMKINSFLYEI